MQDRRSGFPRHLRRLARRARASPYSPDLTFSVRASDVLGNFGTSDSHSWTVDTVAPTVINVSPANGATDVSPASNVTATFSEAMNASTVSDQNFTLSRAGSPVSAQVTYDQNSRTATLDPSRGPASRRDLRREDHHLRKGLCRQRAGTGKDVELHGRTGYHRSNHNAKSVGLHASLFGLQCHHYQDSDHHE